MRRAGQEAAQGLGTTAEGVEWFEGLPEDDQRKVLHTLVLFCGQARASAAQAAASFRMRG